MKTTLYRYDFTYKSKSYKGEIEYPQSASIDLAVYGGESEKTLMRLLANKYGFDSDFTNERRSKFNIMVFRVKEAKEEIKPLTKPRREESHSERESNYAAQVERNRIDREERWAEKDRQREKEERQRIIDLQEKQARDEKEAKEKAERRARANELRSQGKNFQAFLVEFQNGVIMVSLVVGIGLFIIFSSYNKQSNIEDAMKINSELEQIEDSVKIYINNKNYDKALILANKLVHSSHADMEHLDFDAWNGYPKFDEYWTKKREEYKKIILNKGVLISDEKTLENSKEENSESIDSEETPIDEGNYNEIESDTIINQEGLDPEYQEN